MVSEKAKKKKSRMDHLTAIAFAKEAFEALHPRSTWPPWLWSHAISSAGKNDENDYVVHFTCKPKAKPDTETFFVAIVDCWNATTTVVKDTPLENYNINDLEPYP